MIRRLSLPSPLDLFISLIVSFNLALAQPILGLIGNNPEFFLVRNAQRSDIVLVALAWTIGLPLVLWLVAQVGTKLHPYLGCGIHALFLTVIGAVLSIQILERLPFIQNVPGRGLVAIGLLVGSLATLAFYAFKDARSFLRIGAMVPLLVLGLFFFIAPVSKLIWPEPTTAVEPGASSDVPVVMIVFDELPLASLMDQEGMIDGHIFPNFARFAGDATWFRNTTTVASTTEKAVPALVDGQYPRERSIPILSDHPNNLFTSLAESHDVTAFEPITRLCPVEVCEPEPPDPPASRFDGLATDLSIITSHVVLPTDLTQSLPPIDQQWGNFQNQDSAIPEGFAPTKLQPGRYDQLREDDPRLDYHRFLRQIEPSQTERLYFFHSPLPHIPWRFLPSGQQYPQIEPVPGTIESDEGRRWDDNEWLVLQGWQRHLLQVGYVDDFLGRVVRRLKSAKLYNQALVVLASDHGATFAINQPRRALTPETVGHVAPVPLLVKEPGQKRGRIDDRPAQTIDVLPTILDIVGIDLAASIDGRSLYDPSASKLEEKHLVLEDFTFPATGEEKFDVVERKYEAFSASGGRLDPLRIAPEGASGLVHQEVSRMLVSGEVEACVSVDRPRLYEQASPESDPFPALISGTIQTDRLMTGEMPLVISVNGRVAAVTQTYDRSGVEASFYAVLSPSFFLTTGNELRMFVIDPNTKGRLLQPIAGVFPAGSRRRPTANSANHGLRLTMVTCCRKRSSK